MALSRQPGIGQEDLFAVIDQNGTQETSIVSAVEIPDYPSVNVSDRAKLFGEIFRVINQIRRSDGLAKHAADEDGRIDLEAQYGKKTEKIVEGSNNIADRRAKQLRNTFAEAYGIHAMVGAGVDPVKAKAMTRQDYKDFTQRYGLAQVSKKRRDEAEKRIVVSAGKIDGSRYPDSGRLKPKHVA